MNPIKQLHREAMDFFDRAQIAQIKGQVADVSGLLLQAYEREREAAEQVKDRYDLEPTRSVLFRSAAALAKRCSRFREAEQLIGLGLAGNPPLEIAEELRHLFEELNYLRHLDIKGYILSPSVFQMSFAGSEVGPGMADKDEVINRIQWLSTSIYRTAQRSRGDPYTDGIPRKLKREVKIDLNMPIAASFAVAFRLSYIPSKEQPMLPGMGWWPEEIIDELMTCLTLLQSEDAPKLRERFSEEAYLTSFVGLSQLVAPDGERVKLVGFTSLKDGRERQVVLDKPKKALREITESMLSKVTEDQVRSNRVTVEGRLLRADSTNPKRGSQLQVIDDCGKPHSIVIKVGGGDIVRSLYEAFVRVTGEFDGKRIINAEIEPVS